MRTKDWTTLKRPSWRGRRARRPKGTVPPRIACKYLPSRRQCIIIPVAKSRCASETVNCIHVVLYVPEVSCDWRAINEVRVRCKLSKHGGSPKFVFGHVSEVSIVSLIVLLLITSLYLLLLFRVVEVCEFCLSTPSTVSCFLRLLFHGWNKGHALGHVHPSSRPEIFLSRSCNVAASWV